MTNGTPRFRQCDPWEATLGFARKATSHR